MRSIFLIMACLISLSSNANRDRLIDAVMFNDVEYARKLLSESPRPQELVNQADQHGVRPICFVWSPEMLELLVRHGAYLRRPRDASGVCGAFARNPLHYLFSVTARSLFDLVVPAQHAIIRRRIEATAYLMMRVDIRDEVHELDDRIELQRDQLGRLPVDYLRGLEWTPEFIERLQNRHMRDYNAPAGGFTAARTRQLLRVRELMDMWRPILLEEQRQRADVNAVWPNCIINR